MTYRAVEVLKSVQRVLAEDTRTTSNLFRHFEISTPLKSYHLHNEHHVVERLADDIASGIETALVTDAGTPAISDPGFLLVRECVRKGIPVECLPGATAVIPALAVSGLPTERFVFEGFLPHKKGRMKRLEVINASEATSVLYESPHRVIKLLEQLIEVAGPERRVSVSREISKLHEETVRGTAADVLAHFLAHDPRGEFVVVISGKD
ncbi:MAG: rRNA ((1402)-2-O)-methyltransferase [Bacteroidota bacterium]